MVRPLIDLDELHAVEAAVADALRTRELSGIDIIGFGEISVAVGWPTGAPTHVVKRIAPCSRDECEAYTSLVHDYVDRLRALGVGVVDTVVQTVERSDDHVAYVVQPALAPDTIGHRVLQAAEPDPEHPLVAAIVALLGVVDERLSIDAQVTNFAWDGTTATLLDVGTPFVWDDSGEPMLDIDPYLAMIPRPVRSYMKKELTGVMARWKQARAVGVDIVANLLREGLDDWVDPMLQALNRSVASDDPIARAEAEAVLAEDAKTFPLLLRLQKAQRLWQTGVLRRPYDFFVNTTYGESTIQ